MCAARKRPSRRAGGAARASGRRARWRGKGPGPGRLPRWRCLPGGRNTGRGPGAAKGTWLARREHARWARGPYGPGAALVRRPSRRAGGWEALGCPAYRPRAAVASARDLCAARLVTNPLGRPSRWAALTRPRRQAPANLRGAICGFARGKGEDEGSPATDQAAGTISVPDCTTGGEERAMIRTWS